MPLLSQYAARLTKCVFQEVVNIRCRRSQLTRGISSIHMPALSHYFAPAQAREPCSPARRLRHEALSRTRVGRMHARTYTHARTHTRARNTCVMVKTAARLLSPVNDVISVRQLDSFEVLLCLPARSPALPFFYPVADKSWTSFSRPRFGPISTFWSIKPLGEARRDRHFQLLRKNCRSQINIEKKYLREIT